MAGLKLTFKKKNFNLLLPQVLNFVAALDEDKDYEINIKGVSKKRSINQNDFAWSLTDKLSDKLVLAGVKLSKEECHAEMIFRYGQVMVDGDGKRVVYSTKQGIKMTDFFPYAKPIGESVLDGETFTHWLIYRGSKTYDTKEFSIFLTGIIEECREQGIEVDSAQVKSLLEGN